MRMTTSAVAETASKAKPTIRDAQLIKRSIAWRAKYRKGQGPGPCIKKFPPSMCVPHPCNRGGDPVVSLRTRQLGNTMGTEGYDLTEASTSAVAVQENEKHRGGNGRLDILPTQPRAEDQRRSPHGGQSRRRHRHPRHSVPQPLELFGAQHPCRDAGVHVR